MTSAEPKAGELVLTCTDLTKSLAFFTERLGFSLLMIMPADGPRTAVVQGQGLRLRLELGEKDEISALRLWGEGEALQAPGGLCVTRSTEALLPWPPVISDFIKSPRGAFGEGRAGMRYRDLVPGRLDGRLIASHIRIEEGGPVPDYVHFHQVRFQMIYCLSGWVRVVYEDQGPPFVMHPGDCVLQPPRIRHRVLESSPGLEVLEVGGPAEHETWVDHEMSLPTPTLAPTRDYSGQRFVRHQASKAAFAPCDPDGLGGPSGFDARDLGIAKATGGLVSARVLRAKGQAKTHRFVQEACLFYVLSGCGTLTTEGRVERIVPGDALVVPAGAHQLDWDEALELLETIFLQAP